ncbi:MAG: DUF3050 domain-containing protein [Gammaproteobacteria bacterium]|nr:DUF3050 domain-containing protein [Gammaproteobacteria bacterium]
MQHEIGNEIASEFAQRLEAHPVYAAVATLEDLRCFMQHHVYSVWDFMSLIKYLQAVVAPSTYPWRANGDADVRRFINELVLEEESDEHPVDGGFASHFMLYLQAMEEVGADTAPARAFLEQVEREGIDAALNGKWIPRPSRDFTRTTFGFIGSGRPHLAAAALALGREHIIPGMFRAILARSGITPEQAPIFHAYLNRHIHLDADFHAPLSLRLLNSQCAGDPQRVDQAIAAAREAVEARLAFWDGVTQAIQARKVA